MMMNNHFFHLVMKSPWPILAALNLANLGMSMIKWLTTNNFFFFFFFLTINITIMAQWWRDVVREALYEGTRSSKINLTMSLGLILFIVSELWFFISFFWSYFYFSLSPEMAVGLKWPPFNVMPMNFMDIPLLNTLTLLTSGIFITWSHNSLLNNKYLKSKMALIFSSITGFYFLIIQSYEYLNSNFSFNDGVFGSSFFILTGFHGIHVIVGLIFILISYFRMKNLNFSSIHFYGFEYSIWYWHFVDLVWLFLYIFVYWWGM